MWKEDEMGFICFDFMVEFEYLVIELVEIVFSVFFFLIVDFGEVFDV